jgi:hypothetical protein
MTLPIQTSKGPRPRGAAKPRQAKPVTGEIKTQKAPRKSGGGELLKTPAEMARLAGFSKRTLGRITKAKLVPVVRIGRLCFYDPARVMAALQRNLEIREVAA